MSRPAPGQQDFERLRSNAMTAMAMRRGLDHKLPRNAWPGRRAGAGALAAALFWLALPGVGRAVPSAAPAAPSPQAWATALAALPRLKSQEQSILSQLLTLNHAVTDAQTQLDQRRAALAAATLAWQDAQSALDRTRAEHRTAVNHAVRLLRFVEYLGPASQLGMLLGAGSLQEFTQRLGAVTVTVSSVDQTLATLKRQERQLSLQTQGLAQTRAALEQAQKDAQQQAATLKSRQAALRSVLAQLGSRQAFFRRELNQFDQDWTRLVGPYLTRVEEAFSRLPAQNFTGLGASYQMGAGSVELTIPQSGLNRLLASMPELQGLSFQLQTGQDVLQNPQKQLRIAGRWVVEQGSTLRFQVVGVHFASIAIDPRLVDRVVGSPGIVVDLSGVLQGFRITKVDSINGALHLTLSQG